MSTDKQPLNNKTNCLPLCVDLDGTLVKTDTLVEGIFRLIKKNPLYLFIIPFWIFLGKAQFKEKVAQRIDLNVEHLPYHTEFLSFLREEHQKGRPLILATAANEKIAKRVSEHLNIFSEVIASNKDTNLKGFRKLSALEERFGPKGFAYAGNAKVDLDVWSGSAEAVVVNAFPQLLRAVSRIVPVSREFSKEQSFISLILRSLRLHQWIKNLLIFIPLLLAHKFNDVTLLGKEMIAFLAFGFCASSVYLINDLFDLEADRQHSRKKNRPFASGDLAPLVGTFLAPLFLMTAGLLAFQLTQSFLITLGLYFVLTLGYSFQLKNTLFVDVILLAGLYTIRIIAGGVSIQVPISPWLLAFSLFFFFSLALVKRYSELFTARQDNKKEIFGRKYLSIDLEPLASMGIASGYMSVLVLALYVNSPEVRLLYQTPQILWIICPILLYWISRVWLLTHRGKMPDDPIVFAVKDKMSYVVGALVGAILLAGVFFS